MRLIWKKYDTSFNPTLLIVGLGFIVGGIGGFFQLGMSRFWEWELWLIRPLPLLACACGVLIVVRQLQLRKLR
jgi:hypothetical protein